MAWRISIGASGMVATHDRGYGDFGWMLAQDVPGGGFFITEMRRPSPPAKGAPTEADYAELAKITGMVVHGGMRDYTPAGRGI